MKFAGKWPRSAGFVPRDEVLGPIVTGREIPPAVGPKPRGAFLPAQVGRTKPSTVYTGSAMIGVATMHKSNAVPVFSQEQARDISLMKGNK